MLPFSCKFQNIQGGAIKMPESAPLAKPLYLGLCFQRGGGKGRVRGILPPTANSAPVLTHQQQYSTGEVSLDLVMLLPNSHPIQDEGWGHCGSGPALPGRWAAVGTLLLGTDHHGKVACRSPLKGTNQNLSKLMHRVLKRLA